MGSCLQPLRRRSARLDTAGSISGCEGDVGADQRAAAWAACDAERAPDGVDPVAQALEARAVPLVRAADAVVADLDPQEAARLEHADRDLLCAGVPLRVRERLGDDVVRG